MLTAWLKSAADLNFARDMQRPPKSKQACPCDETAAAGARAEVTVGNTDLEGDAVPRSSHKQGDPFCGLKPALSAFQGLLLF